MFKFEKLAVWQTLIEYVSLVYAITKSFPQDERFGLTSQLRRAAVSVSSNIAKGSSRSSDADLSRFIEIAYGLPMETISQMSIAFRQTFMDSTEHGNLYADAEQIARMLSGLRRSLKKNAPTIS